MYKDLTIRSAAVLLFLVLVSAVRAQSPESASPHVLLVSAGPSYAGNLATGEIVREIDDPHTGVRWLLTRDSAHPGGPGRLSPVSATLNTRRPDELGNNPNDPSDPNDSVLPVIHTGDRLIVEENTPVVEARLEAVALSPAAAGSPLNVRLRIGGRVLRAVAVAPGRAALVNEARP
jgi:hypothetical protein